MGKSKIKQWDLTENEAIALRQRFYAKVGRSALLEALQRQLGEATISESNWWEGVRIRLNISKEDVASLVADHESKKVWIKGGVPELDNQPPLYVYDNPSF